METFHTILLGLYKYLLKKVMPTLNARQKKEVLARTQVQWKGARKCTPSIVCGTRLYKAWAQMALFIIGSCIDASQKWVWLALSKVCINYAIHDPKCSILSGFFCDNQYVVQVVFSYHKCSIFLGVSDSLLFAIQWAISMWVSAGMPRVSWHCKGVPPSTTPEEKNPHFATPSGEHEGLWSMQWVQHREV